MEAKGSSSSSSGRPPVKGILKNPSSSAGSGLGLAGLASPSAAFLQQQASAASASAAASSRGRADSRPALEGKKSQKWDEMNILATYHPPGKDYGLMKIDEPSTPYHAMVGDDEDAHSDTESGGIPTADVLAQKLAAAVEGKGPKVLEEDSSDEDEDETELSPEEREKKKQFEMKRKMHYNEGQNIKLARQLIAKELHGAAANDDEGEDEEDEDEEMQDATDLGGMSPELVPAAPSDPLENIAHSLEEVCSGL